MKSKSLFAAALVLFVLGLSGTAGATTTTFYYNGIVTDCPNTGVPPCGDILFEGDAVSGPYVVSRAIPGTSVSFENVLSFSTMVGDFFFVDSDNSSLIDGVIKVDQDGNLYGGFLVILAGGLPGAPPTTVTLDLDTNTWFAEALVPGVPDPIFIAGGTGAFKSVVIPVPGAFILFASALGALGVRRRR
jgi:hypothetical protein